MHLETPVLPTALSKSSRIRLAPNSRNSLPVSVLECFSAFETGIFFPEFSSAEFGALARGFWKVMAFYVPKHPWTP